MYDESRALIRVCMTGRRMTISVVSCRDLRIAKGLPRHRDISALLLGSRQEREKKCHKPYVFRVSIWGINYVFRSRRSTLCWMGRVRRGHIAMWAVPVNFFMITHRSRDSKVSLSAFGQPVRVLSSFFGQRGLVGKEVRE